MATNASLQFSNYCFCASKSISIIFKVVPKDYKEGTASQIKSCDDTTEVDNVTIQNDLQYNFTAYFSN